MILQGVNLSNLERLNAQRVFQNSDSEDSESDEEGATPGGKPKGKPSQFSTPKGNNSSMTPNGQNFNINVERKSELKISFRN